MMNMSKKRGPVILLNTHITVAVGLFCNRENKLYPLIILPTFIIVIACVIKYRARGPIRRLMTHITVSICTL